MPLGVLLGLLSYSVYSCGDALTKSFAGHLSVFEIGFFITLFSVVPAVFAKREGERWRDILHFEKPLWLHIRGITALISSIAITYSFVTVPLAEAYAIAFTTPLFLTLLSVVLLREKVAPGRWALVGLSFVGVLIVVRPGFRELQPGHLTALVSAVASGFSTTVLRLLSGREKRISIIAVNALYLIVGNGVLMIWGFVAPSPFDLLKLAAIGIFGGVALLLVIAALARAPANNIGPTQYVQILWAVFFGSVFYHELPDVIAVVGLVVVVLSGLATMLSDGARVRIAGRWSEFRARRGGPKFTEVEPPEL